MTDIIPVIKTFLQGAGIPVYPENGVPEDAVFPYMTYIPTQTPWEDYTGMPVRIWDRYPNYSRVAAKADALKRLLGEYEILKAGEGYVYLAPGSPWAQPQPIQDTDLKVLYLNLTINTMVP